MDTLTLILAIIGCANWGLVGLFQFDLVAWLFGGSIGDFERGFAREYQHTESIGVVSHLDIGVDAVAYHGDFVRLQAVTLYDARQHIRVGFAERDVGFAACGMGEAGANRATIDKTTGLSVGQTRSGLVAM